MGKNTHKKNRKSNKGIRRQLGEEIFSVLNKVIRLELLEMVKLKHMKVIRELDMQILCVKILRQECSGMF